MNLSPFLQLTLFYRLAQSSGLAVYDYQPGAWASVMGGLLIALPLLCIPVFVLISLCKVSSGHETKRGGQMFLLLLSEGAKSALVKSKTADST